MKRFIFVLYILARFCQGGYTQLHYPDEWWPIGVSDTLGHLSYGNAWLHFLDDTTEVIRTELNMNFEASVAVASDTSGQVLFYSNGCEVRNASGNLLVNGDGLNPGSLHDWVCDIGYTMARSMTVIPVPGTYGKWYMFHLGGRYDPIRKFIYEKLYYTEIEMSHPNEQGTVVQKNILLKEGDLEPFSVIKHGNGRDWWLVMPNYNTKDYDKWLISPLGIDYWGAQSIGDTIGCKRVGGSVFSPNGSKYARTNQCAATVFDFDRCSGEFTNPVFLPRDPTTLLGGGGLAFSPNNRWLYATSDLCIFRADLQSSLPFLDSLYKRPYFYDSTVYVYSLALTYMQPSPNGGPHLMCGRHQDKYYSTFNIVQDTFKYLPKGQPFPVHAVRTLPYFPNFRLYDIPGSSCDTLGINDPTSAIEEVQSKNQIRCEVYPNPASGKLHIKISDTYGVIKNTFRLNIYNAFGQEVLYPIHLSTSNITEVDIIGLASGMYNYVITCENCEFQTTYGTFIKI